LVSIRVLFIITTIATAGWAATLPFLAVYLAVSRDTPFWIIGVSYLATGLLSLVSQVIGGRLVDTMGPKRVMMIGMALAVPFTLVLGYLISVNSSVAAIAILYPISTLARGISGPAQSSLLVTHDVKKMNAAFSILTIGGNLGFAMGPLIGGVLASAYNFSAVFFFSAATSVVTLLMATAWIEGGPLPRLQALQSRAGSLSGWLDWKRDRNVIIFLFLTFCAFLISAFETTPMSLYAASFLHIPTVEIGYLFATNGVVIVILQFPVIRTFERLGTLSTPLIAGCLANAIGFVGIGVAHDFTQLEVWIIVLAIGEILLSVPSQTIISLLSPPSNRGVYQGYYLGAVNAGRSMASFLGPLSFTILGSAPEDSWYIVAGAILAVMLGFAALSPRIERDRELSLGVGLESSPSHP
jgi:MFS family permease